jgi:hypothetical protein
MQMTIDDDLIIWHYQGFPSADTSIQRLTARCGPGRRGSPPGYRNGSSLFAVDLKQELRHVMPVRRQQAHHLTGAAVRSLPQIGLLIEEIQPLEFVLEQRADFLKPGR